MSSTSKYRKILLDFLSPRGNLQASFDNSLSPAFMHVNNRPWDAALAVKPSFISADPGTHGADCFLKPRVCSQLDHTAVMASLATRTPAKQD